jgi:hypothetical protein
MFVGAQGWHPFSTAAVHLLSTISDRMSNGRVGVLFIDIRNAFPSTDHFVLKRMVSNMSGLGVCPRLLASYLEDRTMYVDNAEILSECTGISRGVPQGSVIAPILFSLYYSDVVTHFPERDVSCSRDLMSTMSSLRRNAETVERYLESKLMRLNASKTYYMLFGVPPELCRTAISVPSGQICSTQSFKYLGIYFDSDLSFETHCCKVISKVKSQLYMLLRYPHSRYWYERRLLFFAHIHPSFLYGIECYMHCNSSMRQKLEYLYRKCGRIVLGAAVTSTDTSVYTRLNVLPLRLLFQHRGALLMYGVLRLGSVPVFARYFTYSRSNSRHPLDLLLPKIPTERSRRSLRYWGAKLWNSVPGLVRDSPTLSQFASLYEYYLMTKIGETSDSYDLYDFI